jgi:small conductance mechanosensitive channel
MDISLSNDLLWSLVGLLAGIAITLVAVYLVNKIAIKSFQEIVRRQPKLETMLTIMRRLIDLCVILICMMIVIFTLFPEFLGIIGSVFVAAGFASIVIGLAAQSSLSNIISGIITSISQPFSIGDSLMFRDEFCQVEDIRLMHTVLRTWDNRRLVVPNSLLQNEVIINYSMKDTSVLVPVFVEVSYESDIAKAMQIMNDLAARHPDCLPTEGLPSTVVMDLGDSGIKLRVLSQAKDQSTAFSMTRDLLLEIKKEFDANGVEIPYPRVHLVVEKELRETILELKHDKALSS